MLFTAFQCYILRKNQLVNTISSFVLLLHGVRTALAKEIMNDSCCIPLINLLFVAFTELVQVSRYVTSLTTNYLHWHLTLEGNLY